MFLSLPAFGTLSGCRSGINLEVFVTGLAEEGQAALVTGWQTAKAQAQAGSGWYQRRAAKARADSLAHTELPSQGGAVTSRGRNT